MQRNAPRATSPSDRERIIELFAERQPTYTRAAVLRLLGISAEQLAAAVTSGDVTPEVNEAGDSVIPWEDVASLALEEWTPRMIEAAVDRELEEAIPGPAIIEEDYTTILIGDGWSAIRGPHGHLLATRNAKT